MELKLTNWGRINLVKRLTTANGLNLTHISNAHNMLRDESVCAIGPDPQEGLHPATNSPRQVQTTTNARGWYFGPEYMAT